MCPLVTALTVGLCGCGGVETKIVTAAPPPEPAITTPTTTTPAANGCDQFYLKQKQGLCNTPLGEKVYVVDKEGTLKLKGLTAQLVRIGYRKSFAPNSPDSITAHGKFVVFTLTVTNRTNSPQEFSGVGAQDQVILTLATSRVVNSPVKNVEQAVDAENQIDKEACLTDHKGRMQPGGTVTCQIVFDVPTGLIRHLTTGGSNLLVADFGDSAAVPTATLGSIRTYR